MVLRGFNVATNMRDLYIHTYIYCLIFLFMHITVLWSCLIEVQVYD